MNAKVAAVNYAERVYARLGKYPQEFPQEIRWKYDEYRGILYMEEGVLKSHRHSVSGLRTEAVNMEGREALLSLVRDADPEDEYIFRCPLV